MSAILSVIAWLVSNPDTVAKGATFVTGLVQDAIAAWQRSGSPAEPTDQLLAEWNAAGIDYAAIQAEADKRGL